MLTETHTKSSSLPLGNDFSIPVAPNFYIFAANFSTWVAKLAVVFMVGSYKPCTTNEIEQACCWSTWATLTRTLTLTLWYACLSLLYEDAHLWDSSQQLHILWHIGYPIGIGNEIKWIFHTRNVRQLFLLIIWISPPLMNTRL